MGILEVLGIIFIVLKLIGIISWSWWLVLLPLYGGIMISLSAVFFLFYIIKKKV